MGSGNYRMIDTKNKGQLGVVVVAAGRSSRFEGVDKQIAMLGGEAVIAHSLRVFDSFDEVGAIVLVMSPDNHEAGNAAVDLGGFSKVIGVVTGGKRRQDSVRIGLDLHLQRYKPAGRAGRVVRRGYGNYLAGLPGVGGLVGYVEQLPRNRPGASGPVPCSRRSGARVPALQHTAGQHIHGRRRKHDAGILRSDHDGDVLPGGNGAMVAGFGRDLRPSDTGHLAGGYPKTAERQEHFRGRSQPPVRPARRQGNVRQTSRGAVLFYCRYWLR